MNTLHVYATLIAAWHRPAIKRGESSKSFWGRGEVGRGDVNIFSFKGLVSDRGNVAEQSTTYV